MRRLYPLAAKGMNHQGSWGSSVNYQVDDAVTDGGQFWNALAPNLDSEPSILNPNGQLGSASGAAEPAGSAGPVGPTGAHGAQGATGAQGPQGRQAPAGTNGTGFNFRNAFATAANRSANRSADRNEDRNGKQNEDRNQEVCLWLRTRFPPLN
jgi:hypothetical protein